MRAVPPTRRSMSRSSAATRFGCRYEFLSVTSLEPPGAEIAPDEPDAAFFPVSSFCSLTSSPPTATRASTMKTMSRGVSEGPSEGVRPGCDGAEDEWPAGRPSVSGSPVPGDSPASDRRPSPESSFFPRPNTVALTIRSAGESAHELDPAESAGVRDHLGRGGPEPLLDQAGVHAPEVDGDLEVLVAVERREARIAAQHAGIGAGAHDHRDPAGAVVRPLGVVVLRATAELRPHEREHAVGHTAGLEIELKGRERLAGRPQCLAEVVGLVVVRVELTVGVHRGHAHAQWQGDQRGQAATGAPPERSTGDSE